MAISTYISHRQMLAPGQHPSLQQEQKQWELSACTCRGVTHRPGDGAHILICPLWSQQKHHQKCVSMTQALRSVWCSALRHNADCRDCRKLQNRLQSYDQAGDVNWFSVTHQNNSSVDYLKNTWPRNEVDWQQSYIMHPNSTADNSSKFSESIN
jgi:hypothetical protein